jgi:hypothetical protein
MVCDLHYPSHQANGWLGEMLRITIHENATAQTIQLEGKIVGPWVEELSRAWHSLATSKELHLDLRGVAFVDAEGRELLREIYQRTHAGFLSDSPLTRYYAEDAMQQSPQRGEEGV